MVNAIMRGDVIASFLGQGECLLLFRDGSERRLYGAAASNLAAALRRRMVWR